MLITIGSVCACRLGHVVAILVVLSLDIVGRLRRGDKVSLALLLVMSCAVVPVVYVGGKLWRHLPHDHEDHPGGPQAKETKEADVERSAISEVHQAPGRDVAALEKVVVV